MRDQPAAGLMLPLTVQFLIAMLAFGLNERMARKAAEGEQNPGVDVVGVI